jgi:hypothetical protein
MFKAISRLWRGVMTVPDTLLDPRTRYTEGYPYRDSCRELLKVDQKFTLYIFDGVNLPQPRDFPHLRDLMVYLRDKHCWPEHRAIGENGQHAVWNRNGFGGNLGYAWPREQFSQ